MTDKQNTEKDYKVALTFDGEEIFMMPFVEGMVKDVVLGLARNLKGFEEGKTVQITVRADEDR